ncbi:CdaR family transcriptional regulator [Streptomyces sp. AC627_RSS907]|uniref:PucR family transcriptional regulator n=1 Tax=Streptomyces sp. AC627_RSS907 TaxID=2823684 RepID=UPI001C240B8F|nr:helix-turn-helix domain-containing protein [Streptomyces sp. AC627_RSS907]
MTERFQRARPGSEALQGLVDELAEELGRSVAINDPLVRMICTSRHFGDEDPVRVRALLQGRADGEVIRYVLAQGVAQWSKPGFIDGRDDVGLLPRYVVPLRERGHLLGLMMIVVPQQVLTDQEREVVARAVRPMTAQMYAEHLAADTEESEARDLLLELLGGSPAARDAARQRALDSGLLRDTPYTVVSVVQVSRGQEPPGQIEVALRGAVGGFLQTRSAHGIMAIEQDRAILLQVCDRPPDPNELGEQSRRVIETLSTFLDESSPAVVGVGGLQTGLADAWTSYEQALVAIRAGRRLPALKGVGDWAELGEFAVLLQLPEHALNESLIPKPLRTLTEAHGGPRLRDTLRCFLENAGSIPRTADALRLHRTSLYYRLRQIQEITGLDLDNGADRLMLHMGLRVEELLDSRTDDVGV